MSASTGIPIQSLEQFGPSPLWQIEVDHDAS